MVICCDTSFLFSLYGNDTHSERAIKWIIRCRYALNLSVFNNYELGNALRFAEFRKLIRKEEAATYWAQFEAAISRNRLIMETCNLADILNEANRLSATHTLTEGHRSFDILHVASALVMGAKKFLTFDANQRILALSEGLESPV